MIEAKLERTIIEKLERAFEGFDDVAIVGSWDVAAMEALKGEEIGNKKAIIGVKALPRSYETPTVPYAEIQVQITLGVEADWDFQGKNYLWLTRRLSDILQRWQGDFDSLVDLELPNAFNITGFQLSGGDCGIDRDKHLWQFQQNMSIFGIIQNNTWVVD